MGRGRGSIRSCGCGEIRGPACSPCSTHPTGAGWDGSGRGCRRAPRGTEIGWALAPSAQGKGYATEAARAVIDWAFATLDWSEVIHCITPGNTASVAVAERLGARWMRADIEADGSPVDVFGQSRQAWLAQSNTGV